MILGRNKVALSLSPIALLTLAACKNGGGFSSFSALSGKVEGGQLKNAITVISIVTLLISCAGLSETKSNASFNVSETSRYRHTYTVMPEQNCSMTYNNTALEGSEILHSHAKACYYK
jgi:hypothetical protein